jgi:hypothetical protein
MTTYPGGSLLVENKVLARESLKLPPHKNSFNWL